MKRESVTVRTGTAEKNLQLTLQSIRADLVALAHAVKKQNVMVLTGSGGTSSSRVNAVTSSLTSGRIVLAGTGGRLTDSASLTFNTATGVLLASPDTDSDHTLGRVKLGSIDADLMALAHVDHFSTTGYALYQAPSGQTMLNAPDVATNSPRLGICVADQQVIKVIGSNPSDGSFYVDVRGELDITANNRQGAEFATALTVTAGSHTALTASTEVHDVIVNLARTVQFDTGALATQRAFRVRAPTYAFVGASTLTTAATLSISGAPAAGANATITNTYALWVEAGNARFDGTIHVSTNQVVGARKTGWGTATGSATRTSFDTTTVTLPELAERVKALIDDLHATAGHGLIGT